uniref:Uncharacterized protein n=1 Tax=Anguilla anguilla TaxID=7936 RepID=A0A0E9V0Y8_ANGAN
MLIILYELNFFLSLSRSKMRISCACWCIVQQYF